MGNGCTLTTSHIGLLNNYIIVPGKIFGAERTCTVVQINLWKVEKHDFKPTRPLELNHRHVILVRDHEGKSSPGEYTGRKSQIKD